jgi:ATP-dependent Clp protease ATP-binding subunit ClpC
MMNGYNFTERVRRVLQNAREEAVALRHEYVGTEHILLGLLGAGGVAESALQNLGTNPADVRKAILETVRPGPAEGTATGAAASGGLLGAIADSMGFRQKIDLPYTSRAKKVLEFSMVEARELRHSYVGTEHLLLGLMREERGIAAQILTSTGLTINGVREEVVRLLVTPLAESPTSEAPRRRGDQADTEAAITLIIEHPDGRIEAKKFRGTGDAVSFLNGLEY